MQQALSRAKTSGYGYASIGQICSELGGTLFGPASASEQDAQSRLASVYYKRGIIKSKTNKAEAIKDLQKSIAIFLKLNDKPNEQKVRVTLNSLR